MPSNAVLWDLTTVENGIGVAGVEFSHAIAKEKQLKVEFGVLAFIRVQMADSTWDLSVQSKICKI